MLTVDYITNRIFNSRTYILSKEGSDEVWLVDCGDTDRVLERIEGKIVVGVLLTHAHSDHIYGLEELIEHFPKVRVYTNFAGTEAMKSPKLNVSRYHSEYPDISIDRSENVRVVSEGDELKVLGKDVKIYETPGHAASCLVYIMEDKIFTGDAYIPGIKVFTGFSHSNRKLAQESAERILKLAEGRVVMPGHTLVENQLKYKEE